MLAAMKNKEWIMNPSDIQDNIQSGYGFYEEIANSITHGIGTLLSVAALTLLLTYAYLSQDPSRLLSYAIYGTSLVLLFLASTLYHAIHHKKTKQFFKLLDHCAIYLLIAGTYTPLMLLTIDDNLGRSMLVLIWSIALAGILFKLKYKHRFKWLSLTSYIGMGTISLIIIHKLVQVLDPNGIILLTSGGLIYLIGVYFYVDKKIPFNHAIWHLFVLAGASCHFFMIFLYV